MQTTSAAFLEAIRGSHEMVAAAYIVTPGSAGDLRGVGATLPTVGGSILSALAVVSGDVTLDCTATIRGTAQVVVEAGWPSNTSTSSIAPYGTEVVIFRGVRYGNETVEVVQLGIFRITSVEQNVPFAGQLTVQLQDRMGAIDESKFVAPVSYPLGAGWTWGSVLADLIDGASIVDPTITWDDTTLRDTAITAAVVATGNDRVSTIDTMLIGLPNGGKIAYFDALGHLLVKTQPSIATNAPVYTIDQGPNGVFVGGSRTLTRSGAINTVVVTNEQAGMTTTPFTGIASDTNPLSPTYVVTFGTVPAASAYLVPTVQSNADAASSAATILAAVIGVPYTVQLTAVPCPALEPFDVVTVQFPIDRTFSSTAVPTAELHIIDSVKIPLDVATALSINTRLQVVA